MLRAKIIFCPYEAGYFYGVYNENSDFIRTPELFLRIKKREFCFKPYQRVVHAGAAMRSSIPLPLHLAVGLRPMGIFAKTVLREQAPERSFRESSTRGPPCAARSRCAASRCRASPYGNIYQKTASQASLHAAFRQIFPHGSTFAHFFKNPLAFSRNTRYNTSCCDMIAVKREVAAARQVFPWSECQEVGTLPGRET